MIDMDPKKFPLRVGDKVLIIKNESGANLDRKEEVTITKAVNQAEGYYEAEDRFGEKITGLTRFQLKKK